jgi:hypothetical protein
VSLPSSSDQIKAAIFVPKLPQGIAEGRDAGRKAATPARLVREKTVFLGAGVSIRNQVARRGTPAYLGAYSCKCAPAASGSSCPRGRGRSALSFVAVRRLGRDMGGNDDHGGCLRRHRISRSATRWNRRHRRTAFSRAPFAAHCESFLLIILVGAPLRVIKRSCATGALSLILGAHQTSAAIERLCRLECAEVRANRYRAASPR